MKEFQVVDGGSIRVRATTRAGLVTAALQGLMADAGPRTSELDVKSERSFALSAADFGTLLKDFLAAAAKSAAANKEAYEDVRFTLITDKKAEGAFVGRPAEGFRTPPREAKSRPEVARNEHNEWETTVTLA
ncbi:MAG TPA: hypothetical protein VL426_00660 [Candidatus Binatia bacterium]|jgi:hypothetical protein|nr:hypothetical protein [Candidatus Binatia bacterium]